MNKGIMKRLLLLISVLYLSNCHSQTNSNKPMKTNNQPQLVNRQPAVADQFYPGNKNDLQKMLDDMFSKAENKSVDNVIAIICPHAGYAYSGTVAASSFNQIDANKKYKDIFVIGSSHNVSFNGASIYSTGNYITPLGTVDVDIPLAQQLKRENKVFAFNTEAHNGEHCVEVELPFLQHIMKTGYKIIPIILGTQDPSVCKQIAQALKPYFNSNNLFIISSDFSHYPEYKDAQKIDKITADAIVTDSPDKLIRTLNDNANKGIAHLSTSLCGWTSILTLLYMTENNKSLSFKEILYKNSGDSKYEKKDSVVGYYSIAVSYKSPQTSNLSATSPQLFSFTDRDKKDMLNIAHQTIKYYVKDKKYPKFEKSLFSDNLSQHLGAFVTLYKDGKLRGCIGRFTTDIPLCNVIRDMAVSSATEDTRFKPVTSDEVNNLKIEISVLSAMKKIKSIDEIELGKHGIYIKKGLMSGTFLPQVATETKWTKEELLSHCAKDKAGMGWDEWKDKDTEIYIFEAFVFGE